MKTIEVTGKTLDEAKMNALLELGASSDQVSFEVLDEGSKGLLGLLRRSAKVRATLQEEEDDLVKTLTKEISKEFSGALKEEVSPEEKKSAKDPKEAKAKDREPNKDNKKNKEVKENKPSRDNRKPSNQEPKKEESRKEEPKKEEPRKEEDDHLNDEIRTFEAIEAVTVTGEKVMIDDTIEQRLKKANENKKNRPAKDRPRQDERPGKECSDRRQGGKDRGVKPQMAAAEAMAQEKDEDKPPFEPKVYEIPKDSEAVMENCKSFLTELLKKMGIDTTVSCHFSEEGILEVNIEGEGMGIIIGKRGQTLDSLQYLTTLVINKDRQDHVRMKLDTEGYRERRQETLEKLALNLAKKAKRTGHRVVLEPMNPYERRIIHSVLQQDRGVDTHSDGEEPYRKVVITPKRRR